MRKTILFIIIVCYMFVTNTSMAMENPETQKFYTENNNYSITCFPKEENSSAHKRVNKKQIKFELIEKQECVKKQESIENFKLGMTEFDSKNFGKAFNYFKNAALYNHANAEYNMALFYELGLGVEKDLSKAKTLYIKSKGHGNEKAKEAIQRIEEKENSWWY